MSRFEQVGFQIEEYVGFFGHHYFERVPALQRMEDRAAQVLAARRVTALSTYAWIIARKSPGGGDGGKHG